MRSMNSRFTASDRVPGSFCRPSRGPTSMISMVRDRVMVVELYTRLTPGGSHFAAVDGPPGRIVYTRHDFGRFRLRPPGRRAGARARHAPGRSFLRAAA